MEKVVNLSIAANKDIQRWLLASIRIFAIVVTVVVVAGGRKQTQAVPSPLAREAAKSLERRLCHDRQIHALSGMHCRGVKTVDDGTAHRTRRFHLRPKHEAVNGKSIFAGLKQFGERNPPGGM